MEPIAFAGADHRRWPAVEPEGLVVVLGALVPVALHHLDLLGRRDNDLLVHVPDGFVGHDENRHPVGLRQVEGLDRQVETFLG